MAKGSRYDQQFKENAVRYRLEHPELSLQKAAENLGISDSALKTWLRAARENEGSVPTRGSGNYSSDEAKEIARLQRELSPFSANLPLHSSAHVCRQYSSVSGLPQSVVGTALKTNSPFWSRIRLPSSSSSYTRRCFSPHLPSCSMGRIGQST